jgi:hypothetical protein
MCFANWIPRTFRIHTVASTVRANVVFSGPRNSNNFVDAKQSHHVERGGVLGNHLKMTDGFPRINIRETHLHIFNASSVRQSASNK